jgi:ketosteroid isomerase-like protein
MPAPNAEPESELLKGFRSLYEEANRAWNKGDFRGAYGGLPEDFDYDLAPTWPGARPLRGPDEVVAFFEDFGGTFPDARAELREFMQAGPQAMIVGFEVTGTGESSGARTAMEVWQVWELQGGAPRRVREFLDRGSALQAAHRELKEQTT